MTRRRKPVLFGKYTLVDRINTGGMAEVFKAMETEACPDGPLLAIKRILPHVAEDEDFIKMFQDEAKILAQLEHPNLCRIFEAGKRDDKHYIAMEYIAGRDLFALQKKFRKRKQKMPLSMAAYIIMRAAEGLDYAHRAKGKDGKPLHVIHRDISPQNILVSFQGHIKIIDFGIAKTQERELQETLPGIFKGKLGYMSPEQIVSKMKVDHRVDIFALGVVLYELLTAERLFAEGETLDLLERTKNVDIKPPRHHNDQIPVQLERIVLKSLAKDREQRYTWCAELAKDLKEWLREATSPYDAKKLSQWMQQVFEDEIQKEQHKLVEFRKLFIEGATITAEDEEGEEIQLSPNRGKTLLFLSPEGLSGPEEDDSSTEVGGYSPELYSDEKTLLADAAPAPNVRQAKTILFDAPPTPPKEEPPAQIAPVAKEVNQAPPIKQPESYSNWGEPTEQTVAAKPQKNTTLKDIAVGIGLAALVILGVVLYFWLQRSEPDAPNLAPTMVSTPTAIEPSTIEEKPKTAEEKPKETGRLKFVSIGKNKFSKLKGSVQVYYNEQNIELSEEGEAELPAGKQIIEIRREGFAPLAKEIKIPADGVFQLTLDEEDFEGL